MRYGAGSIGISGLASLEFWIIVFTIAVSVLLIALLMIYKPKRIFAIRKITSLSLLVTGIVALVIIFLLLLKDLGIPVILERSQWLLLHTITGSIVLGLVIIHTYLNWCAIETYLGVKKKGS